MHGPKPDVEAGEQYAQTSYEIPDGEHDALLPSPIPTQSLSTKSSTRCWNSKRFGLLHLSLAFSAGLFSCALMQFAAFGPDCFRQKTSNELSSQGGPASVLAPPYVGSTERHNFPPATPTNAYPSLFPTNVGYPGGTPTGAEPAVIFTAPAYPLHTGAAQLVKPETLRGKKGSKGFDLFKSWSNLSPWYSVDRNAFGLDSSPEVPETCRVTGLHFLHRHGARYPTAWCEFLFDSSDSSEH